MIFSVLPNAVGLVLRRSLSAQVGRFVFGYNINMPKLLIAWIPVILWAAIIFYLSSVPHLELTREPVGNFLSRKAAHLVEYSLLYLLIFRAQGYSGTWRAVMLTTLYGISDELHQLFVPSRTPMVTDALFDLLGALGGAVAWKYLPTRLKKLKP